MPESPRNTEVLPNLQRSLLSTFPLDPYYKCGGFIGLDAEPARDPRLGLASSVSRGLPGLWRAEPGALQVSVRNPSIIQKGTPGSAGEHTFVCNEAIKSGKHFSITAYSPELQEG